MNDDDVQYPHVFVYDVAQSTQGLELSPSSPVMTRTVGPVVEALWRLIVKHDNG